MEALQFRLKGKTAFFKMPEVNSYYYFTYGNIHKVSLLGILGAILGYKGYGQMTKEDKFPEFYEKLSTLKIAIVPKKESKGYFRKKIQLFNNSVGYASREQGGNLIIKQQWLENPEWDIYVMLDCEEGRKVKEAIIEKKMIYLPYLGSNDHPADIENAKVITIQKIEEDEIDKIDSLFPAKGVELDEADDRIPYKYTEYLPVGLKPELHTYELEKMIGTNLPILSHVDEVYEADHRIIMFV